MMIIDTSTYVGHWPFRKVSGATIPELAKNGEKNGITHMVVASINAVFYRDVMDGNMELLDELKAYKGSVEFIPFAVINPNYICWKEDTIKCIKELGFKGIELAPCYHGYSLADPCAAEIFKLAGELGVPVRIEAEFENVRQHHLLDVNKSSTPDEIAALLSASDKTTLIIGGYFPCGLGAKLQGIINSRKNVFVNMRRPDGIVWDGWKKETSFVDSKNLCFGSLAPLLYIEPALLRVQVANVDDSIKLACLSENIRPYLGL